ncbi:MAG: class I SAM-dependent methyltransferase [Phycisphaerales bacterium]|nr:class I SAM-dependent methyltransferase [Phycisphaerales bacterium]
MSESNLPDVYGEADLYCAAFDEPVEQEVQWVIGECERLLGRSPNAVLEPMCGNARYGKAFADRGVRYHGVDASEEMLKRATLHDDVTTSRGDVRKFDVPRGPYDIAWCPINSIRHLPTPSDLVQHLQCVRRHVSDDGLYLVETDLQDQDGSLEDVPEYHWSMPQPDGSTVLAWWGAERADLATRRVWEYGRFERHVDGECVNRSESRYEMLMTRAEDWTELAAAGGFTVEQVVRRDAGGARSVVELSPDLENIDERILLFLRVSGA